MEGGIARSPGFCMTMGTAATMTALAEALGMTLPGASSIPAPDSNHVRMAMNCGRRIVEMVWEDLRPKSILTLKAFENAIAVDMAIGGSTNAIIHLVALARRCGLDLDLRRFDEISRRVPVLANIRPSGKFLMEDFYYAGGLPALMAQIADLLHVDCMTVERSDARREPERRSDPQSRSDPASTISIGCERRDGNSLWKRRTERSGDQDIGGRPASSGAYRPGGRVQETMTTWTQELIARI